MKKFTITSAILVLWLFMAFVVLDIFQENALYPTKTFRSFDFNFVISFCFVSGALFNSYKNKL